MLKADKRITITGNSMISTTQDGVEVQRPVVYFNATIDMADGQISSNMSVNDTALYEANKDQCRADEDEFKAMVRAAEDSMKKESAV